VTARISFTVVDPRSSGSSKAGHSGPLVGEDLVRALHLTAVEPMLSVEIEADERLHHDDRFRLGGCGLDRADVDDVLMDEGRVASRQRVDGELVVGVVHAGDATGLP
jgi:hypothetical protein